MTPSETDLRNAASRRLIADRQAQAYGEAVAVALGALGPGWTPWMRLTLVDADHRENGNDVPAATVYKVYRGQQTSDNSVFVRRLPDGSIRKAQRYEELFGEQLNEPHPTKTLAVRSEVVPAPRWYLYWSALELYHPQGAEALAAGRTARQKRAVEQEAAKHPLFAEAILSEGPVPPRRKRKRR